MSFFRNKNAIYRLRIVSFVSIFIIHFLGCAPLQIKNGVFSPSHKKYTVNIPEKGWEPIKVGKEDLALWHKQYQAMIAFISSNIEHKEFSLELLNSHLFIGMKDKKVVLNETVLVNNQKALHTISLGEMDNYKIKIDSYVIKAGDQVYDLVYWAPSDSFDHVHGDFENIVRSFKLL